MEQRNRIVIPALGALLVAILGGAVWAAIAIQTEYEIGLLAWAIGGLAGYTVAILSRRQTNAAHRIIAVIASLLGIFLGKYFIFGYVMNGDEITGMFSADLFSLFMDNIGEFFGAMDIVFVILAVITAWQMPGRMQQQPEPVAPTDQRYP
ncbi:hypothetical protein GCM10010912_60360 [Paenibacillus albidus]|uniref:Uncharacterized protein n=1 Tax=Paenibacillus albidus TaxID=2041023 RepID=A0A917D2W3_9BACL|nr:hypothetical protein [Paenibacillus albidus]GGG07632.1 hypothetical protein GCM10010912_60360 [Paenibacillus albidus]